MPALSGTHKTNLTSIESALTTTIDSLTNPADASQWSAKVALIQVRTDFIEAMRILRSQ
jgi:hypothetical protein